jgi:quercetin dioxygenase-like cupin family protein
VPVNPPELRSTFVAASSMPWQRTEFDGIEMKILYRDDEGRSTILFRMVPGAVVLLHEHTALEQTFMLEGSLEDGEGRCGAGDFVWRPGGNIHVAHAPDGAMFISIFNRPNRFFDGTKFFTAAEERRLSVGCVEPFAKPIASHAREPSRWVLQGSTHPTRSPRLR